MAHVTTTGFWRAYNNLPASVQESADRNYEILKSNPQHPSLRFKRVGKYWSVRVGRNYRALGTDSSQGIAWFWIGTHAEYEMLTRS